MPKSVKYPPAVGRAKDAIDGCVSSRSLPNGLIIVSRDPADGENTARYLASGIACSGDLPPCGICPECRKIFAGNCQDVIDVRPADGRQGVNVEEVRDFRNDAFITPGELDFKVYIIHDSDKMNASAQNALLKVLEEPPSSVHFILLCSNNAALLPTVRSRCWVINIASQDGSKTKRTKSSELAEKTLEALCGQKRSAFEGIVTELPDDRNEYRKYITDLMAALRNISAVKAKRTDLVSDNAQDFSVGLSKKISDAALIRAYDCVYSALVSNDANVHVLTSQTALLADLWNAIHY